MITIIGGTNRRNSQTDIFSTFCYNFLKEHYDNVSYLPLHKLPSNMFHADMYSKEKQSKGLQQIIKKHIIPANKFYFVIPEYNGGMPGALKLFIDACSIHENRGGFANKKAAILGIASGRAGNLRGMEHLTSILNYMNTTVLPNRQPVSSIFALMKKNKLSDTATIDAIHKQLLTFIAF